MSFNQGDRVMTPRGAGVIVYRRMAPPDYTAVASYSVLLDSTIEKSKSFPFPSCNSTIFRAEEITKLPQ